MDANDYLHIFCTPFGIPPSVDEDPICGATLARDWNGRGKPHCPGCEAERTRRLAGAARRTAAGLALAGRA